MRRTLVPVSIALYDWSQSLGRLLRVPDLNLLSNIRSRSWIAQTLRSLPVVKITRHPVRMGRHDGSA
jgi:hypothetical protein